MPKTLLKNSKVFLNFLLSVVDTRGGGNGIMKMTVKNGLGSKKYKKGKRGKEWTKQNI